MRRARPAISATGTNRLEYERRVNRVIDHIRTHLADELSLAILARIAAFSPFHFHRVFRAITAETLFGFIHRLRIEKAAGALVSRPDQSVLEIALDHGFSSAAAVARAGRARFGMSATEWRCGGHQRWRAARHLRNPGQALGRRRPDTSRARREETSMTVHVRELPPWHLAYVRYVGPYGPHGIPELWTRLRRWMEAHDLRLDATVRLGVTYDDPGITAAEKCRYDACVAVPGSFQPDKWVNVMDVPGGKYALAEFVGTAHEITGVWDRVFSSWLPDSGYQPDDRPCFEIYRGDCTVDATAGRFRCALCLPVRPL